MKTGLPSTLAILVSSLPLMAGDVPKPVTDADYRAVNLVEAELGQLLFFDPILSGNKNISCATCHHPKFATADGVALSLGEGGLGLGPERVANPDNPPEQRIPRNAPALFNLGAHEIQILFHDGRIEVDPKAKGGLRTPMDEDMTQDFATLLSAQTMFPVLSADEMAGQYSENQVSRAVRQGRITGPGGAWDILSKRVSENGVYQVLFDQAYPEIAQGRDITFTDISNAIAAFMEFEWRSDTSPFDAHLRNDATLSGPALKGMDLFYGEARCADCHSGPFQTDHSFYAMGVAQFGPGKAAAFETHTRDDGRARVTGKDADRFAFRTPSLRNVAETAPYGHNGAYQNLETFIRAHLDPIAALDAFDPSEVTLPALDVSDWDFMSDPEQVALLKSSVTIKPVHLDDQQIANILAFLESLSDPSALNGRLGIPATVPSGLEIDR